MAHLLDQVNTFIRGESFFEWHGIVLSSLWIIGSVVAILSRKISVTLHALLFFVIDAATAFFLVGGMLRVYPHMADRWDDWSALKKGHFIGGNLFFIQVVFSLFFLSFNTSVESPLSSKESSSTQLTANLDFTWQI